MITKYFEYFIWILRDQSFISNRFSTFARFSHKSLKNNFKTALQQKHYNCDAPMSSFIVPHFENSEHLTLITEKHIKNLEGFETVTCLQNNISKEEEPWMKDEDKALLRHFLGVARWRSPGGCMTYVEWGSGGSTLWALEYAERVLSIENHPKWCRSMLRHPRIQCAIGICFLSFTQNWTFLTANLLHLYRFVTRSLIWPQWGYTKTRINCFKIVFWGKHTR